MLLSIAIIDSSITILKLLAIAHIVAASYIGDFVTVQRSQNWTSLAEDMGERYVRAVPTVMGRSIELAYISHNTKYKLRFQPVQMLPRLFWHKFPQQQQDETTSVQPPEPEPEPVQPTTTEQPTTMSALTEMPMETEMPEEPEMSVEPTTTATTVTENLPNATTTKSTTTLRPAGSTHTSIMRPPFYTKPQFGNTLKELLLFGSPIEANLIQKNAAIANNTKTQPKGFLSLFEVIKFENRQCSVAMADIRTMDGICYHEFECKTLGGIPTERCAEGVGVCCICCGNVTEQDIVYFESPNYPLAVREMLMCVLVINLRKNVQQLRLDFLMFELNRPTNGDCLDDQFVVSGQNLNFNIPILCGINTGQHIYIHAGDSFERKIYLTFLAKVPSGGRSFNIKVTQLEDKLAPDGCLQYYTQPNGIIKSFNYDVDGTIVDNKEATYLNNLNYVICMSRAKDTCSVVYRTEQYGGDQLDIQIINKDEDENDIVPDGQAGAGIFNCPDDFIAINQVRLCGERLNDGSENEDFTLSATVRDVAAGPIILPVRSDAEYVGRGFRLIYKQELCI